MSIYRNRSGRWLDEETGIGLGDGRMRIQVWAMAGWDIPFTVQTAFAAFIGCLAGLILYLLLLFGVLLDLGCDQPRNLTVLNWAEEQGAQYCTW
jgi:hypothetical protein